jgi:hypothetical protein
MNTRDKSKELKIDQGLELITNTTNGVVIGGLSNLAVNSFRNQPFRPYRAGLIGGVMLFGFTKLAQNLDAYALVNDFQDSSPNNKIPGYS